MRKTCVCLLSAAALFAGCSHSRNAAFEKMRAEMLARERPVVYNTDGCDMLYYPKNLPVTPEGFTSLRLKHTLGTTISTISYCPLASCFAHFCLLKAGDPFTNSVEAAGHENDYNATLAFDRIGHDCLEMALAFSRTNGFERFMSIRMNDSHDCCSVEDLKAKRYPAFFSVFKREHPEYLMCDPLKGEQLAKGIAQWTCVDFSHEEVRAKVRQFVGQFCEHYDIEGMELDFCRHLLYFRNVAMGGVASDEERELMNQLMRDIRAITDKYGRQRGKPILLTARMPDSVAFCHDIGLDLTQWLKDRSLDALIGGCYFNFNDLKQTADFVHGYGAKFYASIDESRIPGTAKRLKLPIIPGRDSKANYTARFAAAMSAGCDGVYLFNLEFGRLNDYLKVDPRETDGLDKIYFATERGRGGYEPTHYLVDGYRHMNLPYIDPAAREERRQRVSAPFDFNLRIGDDFAKAAAKGLKPKVTVMALTDAKTEQDAALSMNGVKLKQAAFADGLFTYEADPAVVKRGLNAFTLSPVEGRQLMFRDFAVKIEYVR